MTRLFCKHQDVSFDTTSGVRVSACRNPECSHFHDMVSGLVCEPCQHKVEPDEIEQRIVITTMQNLPGVSELEQRPPTERAKILDTYCLKCKHCDSVNNVCNGCHCSVRLPVDDYAKYTAFHCPLELW